MDKKKILVTIATRGGSKGVKNKNIKPLLGKPLIYYTLKQALSWPAASRIIVSTDSIEIADIVKKQNVDVPFIRSQELATDSCGKMFVIRDALVRCEKLYNEKFDIVVDLDVTSPVRTIQDLDNCLDIFLKYNPKTLFSVVAAHKNPYMNMVEKDNEDKIQICKRLFEKITRRQDAPLVYSLNASIYFYDRNYLLKDKDPFPINDNCRMYVMPDTAAIDIDREIDFKFLEFLLKDQYIKL